MVKVMERTQVVGALTADVERLLTPEAKSFLCALHHNFNPDREDLLVLRAQRQQLINQGKLPSFLPHTASVRSSQWKVASAPLISMIAAWKLPDR